MKQEKVRSLTQAEATKSRNKYYVLNCLTFCNIKVICCVWTYHICIVYLIREVILVSWDSPLYQICNLSFLHLMGKSDKKLSYSRIQSFANVLHVACKICRGKEIVCFGNSAIESNNLSTLASLDTSAVEKAADGSGQKRPKKKSKKRGRVFDRHSRAAELEVRCLICETRYSQLDCQG